MKEPAAARTVRFSAPMVKAMLKRNLGVLFTAVVLLHAGAASNLQAQRPEARTQLAGVVSSSDTEAPLPGAVVSIQELGLATRTDGDGRFVFSRLPAGRVSVRVTALGYSAVTRSVTLKT